MIKPWKVLQELVDLVNQVKANEMKIEQIIDILDEDSPGTWVPDDLEQREQLEMLGIEWSDIKEIFEEEIDTLVKVAAKRAEGGEYASYYD